MQEFTFQDTGVTVRIRKVSPLLVAELQKRFPAPKPPLNRVMIGDETRLEANEADPDYQATLQEYQLMLELKMRRLLIRFGVEYTLTAEDLEKVDSLRAYWKIENEVELPESDLEAFISYVAIGTPEDLQDLTEAIMRRSQPTPAATEEAVNSFRPKV